MADKRADKMTKIAQNDAFYLNNSLIKRLFERADKKAE